jgi:hypothetical protein
MPDAKALRTKALSILREGRCRVLISKWDGHSDAPEFVVFRVLSSREGGPRYAVDFLDGVWSCTCGQSPCAHVAAVQLVSGHAEAAA